MYCISCCTRQKTNLHSTKRKRCYTSWANIGEKFKFSFYGSQRGERGRAAEQTLTNSIPIKAEFSQKTSSETLFFPRQVKTIGSNCGRSCNTVVIRHTLRSRLGKNIQHHLTYFRIINFLKVTKSWDDIFVMQKKGIFFQIWLVALFLWATLTTTHVGW